MRLLKGEYWDHTDGRIIEVFEGSSEDNIENGSDCEELETA